MDNLFNKLSQVATTSTQFRSLKEYADALSETVADDFRKVYGLDVEVHKQVHETFSTYKIMNKKTGKQLSVFTVFLD